MLCPQCHNEIEADWVCCAFCESIPSTELPAQANLEVAREAPPFVTPTYSADSIADESPARPQLRLEVQLGRLAYPEQTRTGYARLVNVGDIPVQAWISVSGIRAVNGSAMEVKFNHSNHLVSSTHLNVGPKQTSEAISFSYVAPCSGDKGILFEIGAGRSSHHALCGDIVVEVRPVRSGPGSQHVVYNDHGDHARNHVGDKSVHLNLFGSNHNEPAPPAGLFIDVPLRASLGRKQIAPGFQEIVHRLEHFGHATSKNRLCIQIRDGQVEMRHIFVNSGRPLTLGRNHHDEKITLPIWTLPGTTSELISKRHATIQFDQKGNPIFINHSGLLSREVGGRTEFSGGTRDLTTGEFLSVDEKLELSSRSKLSLSDVFELTFVVDNVRHVDVMEYEPFVHRILGNKESQPLAITHSLRINRHDRFRRIEEYVLFPTVASIGRDPGCTIHLEDPSVEDRHAWLWYLGGSFWIEPCQPQCVITTDRHHEPVAVDELVPLLLGHTYTFGTVSACIVDYAQPTLDKLYRSGISL